MRCLLLIALTVNDNRYIWEISEDFVAALRWNRLCAGFATAARDWVRRSFWSFYRVEHHGRRWTLSARMLFNCRSNKILFFTRPANMIMDIVPLPLYNNRRMFRVESTMLPQQIRLSTILIIALQIGFVLSTLSLLVIYFLLFFGARAYVSLSP